MKKKTSWSAETIKTVERWTCDDTKVPNQTTKGDHCKLQKIYKIISHRIHVCYNIYHQYTPNVSYIPAPWILWVLIIDHSLCNPWPVICPSPNQATENDRRVAALASCRVGKTTAWTQKRRSEWLRWRYPLVNVHITMENHNFSWVNPLFLWPCSIAMLVYCDREMTREMMSRTSRSEISSRRCCLAFPPWLNLRVVQNTATIANGAVVAVVFDCRIVGYLRQLQSMRVF